MKEFVRDERKETAITRFGFEPKTTKAERRRIEMLKTAAARRAQVQDKRVIVIRNLAHHRRFRLVDLLHVAPQPVGIVVSFAVNHDAMRHAFDFKREGFEVARLDGRIIKDVEIFSAESV